MLKSVDHKEDRSMTFVKWELWTTNFVEWDLASTSASGLSTETVSAPVYTRKCSAGYLGLIMLDIATNYIN